MCKRERKTLREEGGKQKGWSRDRQAGREGWAGGGRGGARNNYVWVQANMRQLPANPAVLFSSAGKQGGWQQFSSVPRMQRAKVGTVWAGGLPGGGAQGLLGVPWTGEPFVPPFLTQSLAVPCRVIFGKVSVGVSWLED